VKFAAKERLEVYYLGCGNKICYLAFQWYFVAPPYLEESWIGGAFLPIGGRYYSRYQQCLMGCFGFRQILRILYQGDLGNGKRDISADEATC
jgi:hypothetical protein